MEKVLRKKNRIPNYNYSTPGAYFVTICVQNRKCFLADISSPITVGDGFPVPSDCLTLKCYGKIARNVVSQIEKKYPTVHVDKYVIMPNHIHLLLRFNGTDGTGNPSPTLGSVIGWYKYRVTEQVNRMRGTVGEKFFQRSYHDHVIRNEKDYQMIWQYIDTNPVRWTEDCFYEAMD